MVVINVLVAVLIAVTVLPLNSVRYSLLPSGVTAIPWSCEALTTGIVVSSVLVAVFITANKFEFLATTYNLDPSGDMADAPGALPTTTEVRMVLVAVLITETVLLL